MGVKSPGKGPKFFIKEMTVTRYLKCKGGRDECSLFCISALFEVNQPWRFFCLFLFCFCFFLIWSKWNGTFVWPELKFAFMLFRLVMVVEMLAFHPKTDGNIPSVLSNTSRGSYIVFCTALIQPPWHSSQGFFPLVVLAPLLATLLQFSSVLLSLLA